MSIRRNFTSNCARDRRRSTRRAISPGSDRQDRSDQTSGRSSIADPRRPPHYNLKSEGNEGGGSKERPTALDFFECLAKRRKDVAIVSREPGSSSPRC